MERRGSAVGKKKGHRKDTGREMKGRKSEATPWDGNGNEWSACALSVQFSAHRTKSDTIVYENWCLRIFIPGRPAQKDLL